MEQQNTFIICDYSATNYSAEQLMELSAINIDSAANDYVTNFERHICRFYTNALQSLLSMSGKAQVVVI